MSKAIAQTNNQIPSDMLLGHLCFYKVNDLRVSEEELKELFQQNGLDDSSIRKLNAPDVFRRATSNLKNKTITIDYNGQLVKAHIEVNEVKKDAQGVLRLLGRKVVDEQNEELSYDVVARLYYDRMSQNITATLTQDIAIRAEYDYQSILDDICDNYRDWKINHTKDTIRNIANSVQKECNPVSLMSSGICKFVPKTYEATMFAMQGIIRGLDEFLIDKSERNEFELIPVVDTDEQRALISRNAQDSLQAEFNDLTERLSNLLKNKEGLSPKTVAMYIDKYKELQNRASEYETLLDDYMGVVKGQIKASLDSLDEINKEDEKTA